MPAQPFEKKTELPPSSNALTVMTFEQVEKLVRVALQFENPLQTRRNVAQGQQKPTPHTPPSPNDLATLCCTPLLA